MPLARHLSYFSSLLTSRSALKWRAVRQATCSGANAGAGRRADEDGNVDLGLELHLLPAVLELCLSTGVLSEQHVACLSLERLCLCALGMEGTQPKDRYAPLLEFEQVQRVLLGKRMLHLMHGRGHSAGQEAGGNDSAGGGRGTSSPTESGAFPLRKLFSY